eukprot:6202374-Pleurochrysis_carterae.AAC.2
MKFANLRCEEIDAWLKSGLREAGEQYKRVLGSVGSSWGKKVNVLEARKHAKHTREGRARAHLALSSVVCIPAALPRTPAARTSSWHLCARARESARLT